jgi:fibronectin-binding autotransporter adhesin
VFKNGLMDLPITGFLLFSSITTGKAYNTRQTINWLHPLSFALLLTLLFAAVTSQASDSTWDGDFTFCQLESQQRWYNDNCWISYIIPSSSTNVFLDSYTSLPNRIIGLSPDADAYAGSLYVRADGYSLFSSSGTRENLYLEGFVRIEGGGLTLNNVRIAPRPESSSSSRGQVFLDDGGSLTLNSNAVLEASLLKVENASSVTTGNTENTTGGVIDVAGDWEHYSGSTATSYYGHVDDHYISGYSNNIIAHAAFVRGDGSRWDTGQLYIGRYGDGDVVVSEGGVISSEGGTLIGVADGASGRLFIHADSTVDTNGAALVGYAAGSTGRAQVGGSEALWDITEGLYVGGGSSSLGGSGTLTVNEGGSVNAGLLVVNSDSSISTGSAIGGYSGGQIKVAGDFQLFDGGVASSNEAILDNAPQTSSYSSNSITAHSVDITDAGSRWDAGIINIGRSGTGSATVGNGGVMTSVGDSNAVAGGGDITLGFFFGSSGELTVNAGGTVDAEGNGILGVAGTGSITVGGSGALLDFADGLYLGGSQIAGSGTGTLTVNSGGVVNAGSLTIWNGKSSATTGNPSVTSGGQINLVGGLSLVNGGQLTTRHLFLDKNRSGTANMVEAGSLDIAGLGSKLTAFNIEVGATANTSENVATVSDNAQLRSNGHLYVGNGGGSKGRMDVSDGAVVTTLRTGQLGINSDSIGSVTVGDNGAQWNITQGLYVGGSTTASGGSGILTVNDGGTVSADSLKVWNGSSSITTGAVSSSSGGRISVAGELILSGGGDATSRNAIVGTDAAGAANTINAIGGATVTGAGSQWSTDTLTVGAGNTLDITDGGAVANAFGYLGFNPGDSGAATVDGTGSSWTTADDLYVGLNGIGSLQISNGGVALATVGVLGVNAGSAGSATVNGTGSIWTNTSELAIGLGGSGDMQVQNGGMVSTARVRMGANSGSNGTAIVTGAGSTWNNTEFMVGQEGTATVMIQDSGTVSSTSSILGELSGSSGTVTADDAGNWTITGELSVGNAGNGTLNVTNGGSVSSSVAYIGRYPGSSGTVTADGAGNWTITGELSVGNVGNGTLNVTNGGSVSSSVAYIGRETGSIGAVLMDGGYFNTDNALRVGVNGMGTLEVKGGSVVGSKTGSVTVGSSATVDGSTWNNSQGLAVSGTLTVENSAILDVGGQLTFSDSASFSLQDGIVGAGSLVNNIERLILRSGLLEVAGTTTVAEGAEIFLDGGTFTTGSLVANSAGAGYFSLSDGSGGTFNLTDSTLNIGSSGLFSDLWLSGTSINVQQDTVVHSDGTLVLQKDYFYSGSYTNNGWIWMTNPAAQLKGSSLTNTGLLSGQGTVETSFTNLVAGDVRAGEGGLLVFAGASNQNHGLLDILSGGVEFENGLANSGAIVLTSVAARLRGGTLTNTGLVTGTGRVDATLLNKAGGEVAVYDGNTLRFTNTDNSNSGQINLLGGAARFDNVLVNESSGVIFVGTGNGALLADGGLTNRGELRLSGDNQVTGNINNDTGGTIIVSGGSTTTFFDDVVHNGAELRVSDGSTAVYFGRFSGAGALTGTGLNQFEGTLSVGNSTALMDIEGDLGLGLLSLTTIEIAGLDRGFGYDAFDVGGTAILGGELEVVWYDGFSAGLGDSFDIFATQNLVDEFDLVSLALLDSGLGWDLDYLFDINGTSTDILRLSVVAAVPLPAAAWLFGSALLGLMGLSQRNKKPATRST